MRFSSDPTDSGYINFCKATADGKKLIVKLNGELVKFCTVVDEEQGFVVKFVLDEKGLAQLDPTDASAVWTERVIGDVEVELV